MIRIVLCCFVTLCATAEQYIPQFGYDPVKVFAKPTYGKPYQLDPYVKPHPYKFNYEIKNDYGGRQWQQEQGDEYGNKQGSYGYTDDYGIGRQVDYVADENGFRANIKTNEPGTANQNPADVHIYSDAVPVKYEPSPKVYAKPSHVVLDPKPPTHPFVYDSVAPAPTYGHN
ncbi:cuticle protein 10.9-like [Tachypleus tridentatus]|uniref:cuticle protein 10.9-like n=1 Tax=Tachypleus tridentatus TaxID=6853 RepID=UPI003FD34377